MEFTKEEYIEIGDTLSSPAMIAQMEYSLTLAKRDAAGLPAFGWTAAKTDKAQDTLGQLRAASDAYTQKYGQHTASGAELADTMNDAKKWRGRALAIGTDAVSGDAAGQLAAISGPTARRPSRFAEQIRALAAFAEQHKAEFMANGADEAFFAAGHAYAQSLAQAVAFRGTRRHALPAEHDVLDELDGRLHTMLKSLNRAGRALHLSNGDAALAAGYNLHILRRR